MGTQFAEIYVRPRATNVVSDDGKTMTITTKGVGEDGRPIDNVRVYIKR
jgi:hypothetical protein